jgi:hypothetical protein
MLKIENRSLKRKRGKRGNAKRRQKYPAAKDIQKRLAGKKPNNPENCKESKRRCR